MQSCPKFKKGLGLLAGFLLSFGPLFSPAPVKNLTKARLLDVHTGKIIDWRELGGDPGPRGWAMRTLAPLIRGSEQYGVLILDIYLDDTFARKMAEATQAHISFSTSYKLLAIALDRQGMQGQFIL